MSLLVGIRASLDVYCRAAPARLCATIVAGGKFFPILIAILLFAAAPAPAQTTGAAPEPAGQAVPAAEPNPAVQDQSAPKAGATVATPTEAPAAPTPAAAPQPVSTPDVPGGKIAPGTGSSLIPHDLSPFGMFMNADVVVKAVMIGLAFGSLVTWTLLLAKAVELFAARRRARQGLAELARAGTLQEAATRIAGRDTVVARLVAAALDETQRSQGFGAEGVKERAAALLGRIEARAGRAMARGTGVLATIGSTAPFVGLFGTVWGIMNSFIGISKTNTTNLAVVAPGIAEALLATATGLVAAIPAVIIYNMFAREITGYRQVLGDASTEVLRLLSRDLDRGLRAAPRQAAE